MSQEHKKNEETMRQQSVTELRCSVGEEGIRKSLKK